MTKDGSTKWRKLIIRTFLTAGIAAFMLQNVSQTAAYIILGAEVILFVLALGEKLRLGSVLKAQVWIAILSVIGVILMHNEFRFAGFVFITLAWIYFVVLLFRVSGVLLKFFFGIVTLVMLLFGTFLFMAEFSRLEEENRQSELTETEPEIIEEEEIIEPDPIPLPDADSLISHLQVWQRYQENIHYRARLQVFLSDFRESTRYRLRSLQPLQSWNSSYQYWGHVYRQLEAHDRPALNRIVSMFRQMRTHYQLNDQEFANLVVSCVQHIPYSLVIQGDCQTYVQNNPDYEGTPCSEKVQYGIHSPVEFMAQLAGDCDTRTVFLYTILKELGYPVAILNSDNYGHSILGMALPGQGDYVQFRGKKYYTWETTGKNWRMGQLPPVFGNVRYWEIALVSQ